MALAGLTSASGFFERGNPRFAPVVVVLSVMKFLLVAFFFMEMRKANAAWGAALIAFAAILSGAILLLR
ncbi:MAG: cytochrome C oxidase subunit IV family protein [Polyangiaceae bacterium]|nr:cytochrome C oxidase subunit IV family protein [Polyangiaceae bacterium]